MNEIYTVEELAYRCSDFGELTDKIVERINSGDVVRYGSDQLDSTHVMFELIEDDSDKVNELLSCLSIHTPLSRKFAQMIDDKTQELAEEAARSYKGKYDE
jgi:K+/H+ antiporter YhaU regulatory subunit KhtT